MALLLVPLAHAQGDDETPGAPASAQVLTIDHDTTWTTPQAFDGWVNVTNNSTLTIRGTTVLLDGLSVAKGAHLVVESRPDAPATIGNLNGSASAETTENRKGFQANLNGDVDIRGLPDAPVTIDGVGGLAVGQGGIVVFRFGMEATAAFRADWLRFQNYTSGLRLIAFALTEPPMWLNHTTFSSSLGDGVTVGGRTTARLNDVTFEGPGAGLFVAKNGIAYVENATFEEQIPAPINAWGARLELRNVTAHNIAPANNFVRCVTAYGGVVTIDGLTCEGYAESIEIHHGPGGVPLPTVDARNVRIVSSPYVNNSDAINIVSGSLRLTNATIENATGQGIAATGLVPTMENVTFRGVADFDVLLLNLPRGAPLPPVPLGEPGKLGWMASVLDMGFRVLLPNGTPAPAASVVARNQAGATVFSKFTDPRGNLTGRLLLSIVGPDGRLVNQTFSLSAQSADGTSSARLASFAPSFDTLVVTLSPNKGFLPLPGWIVLTAALAAGALLGRRRPS